MTLPVKKSVEALARQRAKLERRSPALQDIRVAQSHQLAWTGPAEPELARDAKSESLATAGMRRRDGRPRPVVVAAGAGAGQNDGDMRRTQSMPVSFSP